jgi:hypothetical protein
VGAVGPFATFAINPWGNFDPISVVKMLALSTLAFLIASLIFVGRNQINWSEHKPLLYIACFFVFWMLMVMFFSGAPLNQQFWGMFGRNTGFLTYLSLTLVLIGAALIRDLGGYKRITDYLLICSIPMTIYCLVQISGNDPIGWSYKSTFGTLGNVNFLSAFMGIVALMSLAYLIGNLKQNSRMSIALGILIVTDLVIILSTGSIQGVIIFGAGTIIVVALWLRTSKRYKILQTFFILASTSISIPVILGILNVGPLARFLFQNSTKLRGDYIHAGWEMTTRFPIFGVGMDSYGDWYRESRGELSTEAGIDRIANTAHNIFLDISSNGGFPLLAAYLGLIGLAALSSIKTYKVLGSRFDPVFTGLLASWIAYQVQALISINQIGVGVWGWIFTGALIGYSHSVKPTNETGKSVTSSKKLKGQLLPASAGLVSIAGAAMGFSLSWLPVKADSDYFQAARTGSLEKIVLATREMGSTAWHSEMALNDAVQIPAPSESKEIATYIVNKYPRNNFAWKIIFFSEISTPEEKALALAKLKEQDPFYPSWK